MRKSDGSALIGFVFFALLTLLISYAFSKNIDFVFKIGLGFLGTTILLGMITLPWNLYFEVQGLLEDQGNAGERGTEIKEKDRVDARRLAKRLFILCMALHFGTAIGVTIYTQYSPNPMGYFFAGAFALSATFRPLASFYKFQMARLRVLRGELRFPRDDIVLLKNRVDKLEPQLKDQEHDLRQLDSSHTTFSESSQRRLNGLEEQLTKNARHFDDQIEKISGEFERSIERLTEDKELLRGIKAFLKLVKTSQAPSKMPQSNMVSK
jgi:hypothetical protein